MLDIRLRKKAKRLYKELYEHDGWLDVKAGYVEAANELATHGLIEGRNLSYKGYNTTMVLTRKGWEYYKSNPKLKNPRDWKFYYQVLLSIAIALIGWLYFT